MTGYKVYQENRVEGASQLGLVHLSYEVLYKSLAHARLAIEAGDLAAEAEHTCRAMEAIAELATSLNMEMGGAVAKGLASLYAYMMKQLSGGMCTCSTEAVEEVMQLVHTLREGWQQLAEQEHVEADEQMTASGTQR